MLCAIDLGWPWISKLKAKQRPSKNTWIDTGSVHSGLSYAFTAIIISIVVILVILLDSINIAVGITALKQHIAREQKSLRGFV